MRQEDFTTGTYGNGMTDLPVVKSSCRAEQMSIGFATDAPGRRLFRGSTLTTAGARGSTDRIQSRF